MRKDKLYLLTFLSVAILYSIMALLASSHFLKIGAQELIEARLAFGKKEARTFASLVGHGMGNDIPKDSFVAQIQENLQGTDGDHVFLSVIDWSGKVICHPEIQRLGQDAGETGVSSVEEGLSFEAFQKILQKTDRDQKKSLVTFMLPIINSDWIVVSHTNLMTLDASLERLKNRYYALLLIIGLIIIPSFVLVTRYLGGIYEKKLEMHKQRLEEEVLNLSKLNRAVVDYQERVTRHSPANGNKKRILTQLKNELLSIPTAEIAYIFTENTITYVVGSNGIRSTTNSSLEELYSQLDPTTFFRGNRQFIIAITSIDKIVKYGNNQLKILVDPPAPVDILINKNKAAEFKNWLNS